jgi:hypothetical protein
MTRIAKGIVYCGGTKAASELVVSNTLHKASLRVVLSQAAPAAA